MPDARRVPARRRGSSGPVRAHVVAAGAGEGVGCDATGVGLGVGAGVGVVLGVGVGVGEGDGVGDGRGVRVGVGRGVGVGEGVGGGDGTWADEPGRGLDATSLAAALANGGTLAAPGDSAGTLAAALGGCDVVTAGVEDEPRSGREITPNAMMATMKSSSMSVVPRSDASRSAFQVDCRRSRPERMG